MREVIKRTFAHTGRVGVVWAMIIEHTSPVVVLRRWY